MSMNGFNSQYFNRNLLNSLKDTLRGMVTEQETPPPKKKISVGMRFDGGSIRDERSTAKQAAAQEKLKIAADALTAETTKTGRWDDESRWDRRDAAYVDPTTPEARVRRSVADGTSPASVLPSTKTPTNQTGQSSSPAQSARQAAAQNTRETETALRGVVGKEPVPPPVESAIAALDNAKKENTYFGAGIAAEYKSILDQYPGKAMTPDELDASEARMDALQKTSADAIQVAAEAGGNKKLIDQAKQAPRSGPATTAPSANPQTPAAPPAAAKPQAPVRAGGASPAVTIWQQLADELADQNDKDNLAAGEKHKLDIESERKTERDRSFNAALDRAEDRAAAKKSTVGVPPALAPNVEPWIPPKGSILSPLTPAIGPIAPERSNSTNVPSKPQTVGAVPTAPATPTPPRESVNGRTYDALTDLQLQNIVRNTKTTKFGGELLDDSKQKQTFIQARDELARRAKK